MSIRIVLLCAVLISGCTANTPHRPFVPTTKSDDVGEHRDENKRRGKIGRQICENNSYGLCAIECYKEKTGSTACNGDDKEQMYKLFIVEIDEQGRFYDDRQFHYLLDYLAKKEEFQPCEGKSAKKGVSIVTLVHGWRHNAINDDSNVEDLRSILRSAYQSEKASTNLTCGEREVIGVYVGWRGKSLSLGINGYDDPLELFSFWDRKNTANNVAMGSVRELLSVLQQFVRYRDEYREERKQDDASCRRIPDLECKLDRLIIVGHSFGGLIVFNALSEGLLNGITSGMFKAEAARENDDVYPPKVRLNADLVVLINPAIEGMRLEPIYQAIKRRDAYYGGKKGSGFNMYQNPVFVAITAKNDWATGLAFPWARGFSTIFEDKNPKGNRIFIDEKAGNGPDIELKRSISDDVKKYSSMNKEESEANNAAMGHVPRYWTHKLNKVTNKEHQETIPCLPEDQSDNGKKLWIQRFEYASKQIRWTYYKTSGRDFIYYCGDIEEKRSIQMSYLTEELRQKDLKDEYESLPYNSPVWIVHSENSDILDGHSGYEVTKGKLVMPFIQMLYHQLIVNTKLDFDSPIEAKPDSKTEPPIEKEPMK